MTAIALNLSLIAATAVAAISLLPTFSRVMGEREQTPDAAADLSESRLTELLLDEISANNCQTAAAAIDDSKMHADFSQLLTEVGLDIYGARDALIDIDAPEMGFVAALTEQLELEAGSVLQVVISKNPDFEGNLDFEIMLNRATLELVAACELEDSLAQALIIQQSADSAVETLLELAAESAWYPRGFTRSFENLAWGWTSESGSAPCQNCVYWKVTLVARDGCLGGALVAIKVLDGETELVTLRETWDRLREGDSVTAEFSYQQLNPDLTAQVLTAECFSHVQP